LRRTLATAAMTWSPKTCPCVSLIGLKLSMSKIIR